MNKTVFVSVTGNTPTFPFRAIMEHYETIRDCIATLGFHMPQDQPSLVLHASHVYAFNCFKSVSLLLPELYHESAAVVLRQLWEVSLNLHWIGESPEDRALDFSNYTSIEMRRGLERAGKPTDGFDKFSGKFQARFQKKNRKGKTVTFENFANKSVRARAELLGIPWATEYISLYALTSMHAHGAPGAIMHQVFVDLRQEPKEKEESRASIIALLALRVMIRNVELLHRLDELPDIAAVQTAYQALLDMLSKAGIPQVGAWEIQTST